MYVDKLGVWRCRGNRDLVTVCVSYVDDCKLVTNYIGLLPLIFPPRILQGGGVKWYIPADSLPTTKLTFPPLFNAPFRAVLADDRNEERDTRGRDIVGFCPRRLEYAG